MLMVMSSVELVHAPLEMVQRSVADVPTTRAVTAEEAEAVVVMDAVPETRVHAPVPTEGVFPARVAVVMLHKF